MRNGTGWTLAETTERTTWLCVRCKQRFLWSDEPYECYIELTIQEKRGIMRSHGRFVRGICVTFCSDCYYQHHLNPKTLTELSGGQ